jgi:LEA14-like dessication related protein
MGTKDGVAQLEPRGRHGPPVNVTKMVKENTFSDWSKDLERGERIRKYAQPTIKLRGFLNIWARGHL